MNCYCFRLSVDLIRPYLIWFVRFLWMSVGCLPPPYWIHSDLFLSFDWIWGYLFVISLPYFGWTFSSCWLYISLLGIFLSDYIVGSCFCSVSWVFWTAHSIDMSVLYSYLCLSIVGYHKSVLCFVRSVWIDVFDSDSSD